MSSFAATFDSVISAPRSTVSDSKTDQSASGVRTAGSPLVRNEALSRNMPYLTDNDHVLIMSKSKPLTFGRGESLIREGSPSPAFYMIRTGSVRVERGGCRLATLAVGNVCGEMTLLEASPASASVVAEEEVIVDTIEVNAMREIFLAFPHLGSRFYRSIALTLSGRLRDTSCRLADLERKVAKGLAAGGVR